MSPKDNKPTKEETKLVLQPGTLKIKAWKPQRVLESFFPRVKSKRAINHNNFQGFDKRKCRFADNVGKLVHCPPGYGTEEQEEYERTGTWSVCNQCFLNPCVTIEWKEKMDGYCKFIVEDPEQGNMEKMLSTMSLFLEFIMGQVLGAYHVRRLKQEDRVPDCATQYAIHYFTETRSATEEPCGQDPTEDPDDELVAGAIDKDDYIF